MFNWIKPKNPAAPVPSDPASAKASETPVARSKKDELISEAMGHARVAREAIGEETLSKVRDLMQKQQATRNATAAPQPAPKAEAEVSPMEQAKKILLSLEPGKLADHLKYIKDQNKLH